MRQDYPEFVARDAEILAVGPDDPESFRRFWAENDMPFVGLADPRHAAADLYQQEVNLFKLGRMPALFVVDRSGRVVFRHHAKSMSDIPTDAEVLAVLDRIADD